MSAKSPASIDYSAAALKKLKVAELQELCKSLGLDDSGTKDKLIARLQAHQESAATAPAATATAATSTPAKEPPAAASNDSKKQTSATPSAPSSSAVASASATPVATTTAAVPVASTPSSASAKEESTQSGVALLNGQSWEDVVKKEAAEKGEVLTEAEIKARARAKKFNLASPAIQTPSSATPSNPKKTPSSTPLTSSAEAKKRRIAWLELSEEERERRMARCAKFGTKDNLYEEYKAHLENEKKKEEAEKLKAEQAEKLKMRQERFAKSPAA